MSNPLVDLLNGLDASTDLNKLAGFNVIPKGSIDPAKDLVGLVDPNINNKLDNLVPKGNIDPTKDLIGLVDSNINNELDKLVPRGNIKPSKDLIGLVDPMDELTNLIPKSSTDSTKDLLGLVAPIGALDNFIPSGNTDPTKELLGLVDPLDKLDNLVPKGSTNPTKDLLGLVDPVDALTNLVPKGSINPIKDLLGSVNPLDDLNNLIPKGNINPTKDLLGVVDALTPDITPLPKYVIGSLGNITDYIPVVNGLDARSYQQLNRYWQDQVPYMLRNMTNPNKIIDKMMIYIAGPMVDAFVGQAKTALNKLMNSGIGKLNDLIGEGRDKLLEAAKVPGRKLGELLGGEDDKSEIIAKASDAQTKASSASVPGADRNTIGGRSGGRAANNDPNFSDYDIVDYRKSQAGPSSDKKNPLPEINDGRSTKVRDILNPDEAEYWNTKSPAGSNKKNPLPEINDGRTSRISDVLNPDTDAYWNVESPNRSNTDEYSVLYGKITSPNISSEYRHKILSRSVISSLKKYDLDTNYDWDIFISVPDENAGVLPYISTGFIPIKDCTFEGVSIVGKDVESIVSLKVLSDFTLPSKVSFSLYEYNYRSVEHWMEMYQAAVLQVTPNKGIRLLPYKNQAISLEFVYWSKDHHKVIKYKQYYAIPEISLEYKGEGTKSLIDRAFTCNIIGTKALSSIEIQYANNTNARYSDHAYDQRPTDRNASGSKLPVIQLLA